MDQEVFDPESFFEAPKPFWLSTVCHQREHLENTALAFLYPDGRRHHYLFLYAYQSPHFACFAPLRLVKEYGATPLESDGTCAFPVHVRWNFVFKVDYAQQVSSSEFPSHPGSFLALLFFCKRLSGGHVVCDSEYVAFQGWEDGLESHKAPETMPQSQLTKTKE